ncbi:ABC-type transporter, permease component: HAAT family [Cupriavidus necator]|uniref:ABC-type transporter, permease component: HAAT family n=1 Tax=Cupriavidus necator (strain ATCC 17699 / DSM 428 / KCTC 22496 / NCIMB 10442 / H16 / Stanier 337) TaxID=381666 RepID=Q0KC90_CUPNH|nr:MULTISPECIES: branched-chain amino acid ABC transporter permease [Cupriavidus]EON21556.1 ABC transporter permease [Cupriavidus sp. GA3-3]KUE89865.1 ABC transporter permease [Cupriavidus necator]QCC00279.1 branched-chain amino acid ABC transporter permease [Cupriavidus necator H16]QQB76906.1 branched-chain amino acid ABC transporter permease [Cupriavidus necator]WKA42133.1 branched-chain amino acid ABC transporter permease [Cupriavidus necator]
MSTTLVFQAILSGITNGFVYALIGVGMAIIFKGTRIVNAMQGEFAVIGALVAVFALKALGLPYALAIAGGIAAGAVSGLAIDVLFVRPMLRRGAGEESFLLLTIGLAFALSAAALYFGGRDSHLLPALGGEGVVELFGATTPVHALALTGIAVLLVGALRLFYTRTLAGLAMTAASLDPDGATTTGINVRRMRTYTFLLGGGFGAIAGVLVTPLLSMNYQMGIGLTLKGFAAAILGGLGNPLGAVAGGLLLGLAESLAVVGFPSGYRDVIALSILIVIMILLPNGVLGRAGRKGG